MLYVCPDNAAVSMKSAEKVNAVGGLKKMSVSGVTIDAFVREHNITNIALLKIDTQGLWCYYFYYYNYYYHYYYYHYFYCHYHCSYSSLVYPYLPLFVVSVFSISPFILPLPILTHISSFFSLRVSIIVHIRQWYNHQQRRQYGRT